ncbi:hypothetical protein H7U19_16715 [Hyunsoonleella sp. SJ7]|uniref:Uncharacterized protein n=1 Tax=Hyunsoonleella aquatilis TaxID=2762758 RepID=A0A923HKL3_9FLAO|nr:hypothetical protein [Hyunsoonleella aquatilis]MBC3760052.1 hypothetical protein [Hyunsoonleella aquatilis]
MKKINWSLINSLGKMRFSKSSYYYLVIIPILVKLMGYLDNPFILILGENSIKLNLELPFSWYLFYFGAIFIAIGTFIYQVFCPSFIKKFQNYGEFISAGESDNYLSRIESKYAKNKNIKGFSVLSEPYLTERKEHTKEYERPVKRRGITIGVEKEIFEYTTEEYKTNIKYQEERKNYFNELYSVVNDYNKPLVVFAFITYVVGFSSFLFVIIQNIRFVIRKLI